MSHISTNRRGLSALAAACLLSVSLPAAPALAQKVKNKDQAPAALETTFDVSIPMVDSVGSNIDNATLAEILSGDIAAHASALAALDANSITVPEITLTVVSKSASESYESTITFNDLALTNVVDGVAQSVSLGGIDMTSNEGDFNFGTMSAADMNIGGMLGFYGLVPASGSTEMETIYRNFKAEGGSFTAEDVSCTFGTTAGAEFKARPLKTSMVELMGLAQQLEDEPEDLDPVLLGKIVHMYADMFTAFETSEVTFDGLSCDGVDDEGRPLVVSIDGMTMGAMKPGIYPSISMDGFKIDVEGDGSMSLDNFTFKPMDLSGPIALIQSAPEELTEAWFEANARALIPAMEGLLFSGFAMDIPDPDNASMRLKAQVDAFDLTLANYVMGIPSDIDMSGSGIQATLPEGSGDETIEQMRALGITDINSAFRLALAWNEAANAIDIEEISVSGVDLASVFLSGTINNATKELFSGDETETMMAAMTMAVKKLDLTVIDAGLSDIILSVVAAEQGADPETLRPVFAGLAQGTVVGMMAGAADAAKLGEAINSFVSGKAKTLEIGLEAKTDPGLGMMDFMEAEEDPTTLLGKVNISAAAK